MKKLILAAAALAAAAPLASVSPASATMPADIALDTAQTGGIQGLYANGTGSVTNAGSTTIPAGAVIQFSVHNEDHQSYEIHVNAPLPHDPTALSVAPNGLQSWSITTTDPLEPGEVESYGWVVLHYAPWHRVHLVTEVVSLPAGYEDTNPANDRAEEHNL